MAFAPNPLRRPDLAGGPLAGVLLLGALLLPRSGSAQVPGIRIQDCRAPCPLVVTDRVSLGDATGPGFVGEPSSLAIMADGRYVLTDWHDQDRVKFFAPDGSFIRALGRRGKGPGEFEIATRVIPIAGDSLEVFDLSLGRVSLFGPDLRVQRTTPLPFNALELQRLAPDRYAIYSRVYTPESAGLPLHLIAEGRLVRSFGADPPIGDVRNSHLMHRMITAGSRGNSIWAGHLLQYALEEWDLDGHLLRRLERDVPWFRPQSRYGFVDAESPPGSGLQALHHDPAGLLWTAVRVPDERWRDALYEGRDPYGRPMARFSDPSRYYDSVIEVIDIEAGRVLGTVRIDLAVGGFTGDGLLWAYEETELGEPKVRVLEVRLP